MSAFGAATPDRLGGLTAASVPAFPTVAGTYTDPTGAIIVPSGALDKWFTYRNTLGAVRGDVIALGDSTTFGSGGNYSWLQRIRDLAAGASSGGPAGFGIIDGGKGMFGGGESGGITYDAPEVNGVVSSNFGGGFPDVHDNLDGQYFYDTGSVANHTTVLQFRATACRLWYSARNDAGSFTYSVDGGGAVTVNAHQTGSPISKFVYISGLTAGVTHTLTITNLASAGNTACYVALAPVNATGLATQKFATNGDTIVNRFFGGSASAPFTQAQEGMSYQTPLGLVNTSVASPTYKGAAVDGSYGAGATNPVLAISHLGFNDLTNAVDSSDLPMWTEYVKKFAGACADAGCPGIVASGQLPFNASWPTFGAARFNAMKTQALASGLVFVDLLYPIAGPSLSYSGGTTSPHLSKAQYQAQADFLWNNLLGLTT